MYFQTGSIVGRSQTQDGGQNPGKVPIQELQSSAGGAKLQSLIQTYQYYLQMIRDVTGLNEARDGSMPNRDSLVGLQKMAAASSNTATKHILDASLFLTLRICENISKRVGDALQFPLTANALKQSISVYNVETLKELENLELHDFGIYLQVEPDEEEKAQLEQNIQVALQTGGIDLEDAIDLREINNLKLANQALKYKRKKKMLQEQANQQANIQAQAQANAQTAESAAMSEVQKQQALSQTQIQVAQAKNQFEIEKMEHEARLKQQLMELEFQYNMQLAQVQAQSHTSRVQMTEDKKDQREKLRGSIQSDLNNQRQNNLPPKDFESAGFDNMGGFDLAQFEPK